MKRSLPILFCLVLLCGLIPQAAAGEETYLLQCDFEAYPPGDFTESGVFYVAHKQGRIAVETLDGSQVLAFRHAKLEANEDCYLDLLPHSVCPELGPVYCISYDFRYESAPGDAAWQILCSRQTPAGSTQFQQVGYVRGGGVVTVTNDAYTTTLEADHWYRFTAMMDEEANLFDLYIDSVPVAVSVPYSIGDPSAEFPERLRIGMGSGTSEYVMFVDNIEVYNGMLPRGVPAADLSVVERGETALSVVPPVYTRVLSVSRPVWYALGTAASLVLAAAGVFLLRRVRKTN